MPDTVPLDLDQMWVLLAAALVFLMQGGFLLLEVGSTRPEHAASVGLKNLMDWIVTTIGFTLVGFGLMFGSSLLGLFGTDLYALAGVFSGSAGGPEIGLLLFLLFQLGFAATAVTIVSGAMAERTGFVAYMGISAVTAMLIYPVFGHWAWAGTVFGDTKGWLAELGFLDFAGSTVVHSVGGWVALVGIALVGPRLGRYGPDGSPRPLAPGNLGLSALGVLVLWVGWWGFNGGSTLALDSSVLRIILVTGLAGATAGLVALLDGLLREQRTGVGMKLLGGTLCGLVAVTASADAIAPGWAIGLGAAAGLVHNLAARALHRWHLDDPVGAVPVHLAGGVLGTLAVAVVVPAAQRPHGAVVQLGVQALGVLVCALWSVGVAYVAFRVLRTTTGLRVSPAQERAGDVFGVVGATVPHVAGVAVTAPQAPARTAVAIPPQGGPLSPPPAAPAVAAPAVAAQDAGSGVDELGDDELADLLS